MKGILSVLVLATTLSCLLSRPYKAPDSDPTVLIPSVDHGTIVIEDQTVNLSYCDLLVDKFTMYWCSNQLFVVKTDSTTNLPSTIQMEDRFVMDVHMDGSIILKVGPRSIDVVREFELIKQFYFHSDLLLMARVKAKPTYFILSTITKNTTPKGGNLTSTLPESPYYISIYLEGAMPSMHKISFPVEKFDLTFTDNSFRDAIIYSDPWYGHSYFIVSLEKTWISVFELPFESSQIHFSFTKQLLLESDWEILEMEVCENYFFLLVENKRIKGLKILSYRIQTSDTDNIGLEKEGEIDLNNFVSSSSTYIPQFKVKFLDEIFLVMLNIPGEKIVLYYYQRPLYESFSLEPSSLSGPFEIVYKNSVGSSKIGYSFDYIKKQQGFSLTPISPGLKHTYFIPYCTPNFYHHPTRGCVRCESGGFSFGADAASCQSCSVILEDPEKVMGLVEAKCPSQCEEGEDKFGKMCLSCMDEMNRLTAKSLSKQEWRVDLKGDCELYCDFPSVPHPQLGRCVDERTLDLLTDNCAQVTDCVECSLTQTCTWENDSCRQKTRDAKVSILEDFLKPASMCSKGLDICGEAELTGSFGYISFSSNSMERKNMFCKWNIKAQNNDKNRIELRVILENTKNNRNIVPTVYYESSDHHTSSANVFSALEVSNGIAHKNLVASEVVLYTLMDQYKNQETPVKVRIEYRIRPSNDFVEGVLILFRWIYYVIFLFLITIFVFAVAQKIINYCQKRRLIRDLGEFHEVDEIAEGEHQKLKIENILKSNKVMCKVVYEDEKSNKYGQTECSICLEDFNKGDNLAKFSCDHIFHIKCFENWVKLSNFYGNIKCAVCNKVII